MSRRDPPRALFFTVNLAESFLPLLDFVVATFFRVDDAAFVETAKAASEQPCCLQALATEPELAATVNEILVDVFDTRGARGVPAFAFT